MDADTVAGVAEVLALCIARGSLYALIAAGFALVLGAGRVLNLFHGSFFLLGAYGAYLLPIPIDGGASVWFRLLTDILVAVGVGGVGLAYYYFLLRPARQSWLRLVTVGLASNLAVAEIFRTYYGTRSAYVPPILAGRIRLGAFSVSGQEVVVVVVAAAMLGALAAFLTRSLWGKAIRAVAQDAVGARLVGISPTMTLAFTVALSGALAGLAGALAAPVRVVRPDMWSFALLKALTVVIVGGISSLRGTCLAAYGLGAVEVLTTLWLGETAAELAGVFMAIGILAARPRGVLTGA